MKAKKLSTLSPDEQLGRLQAVSRQLQEGRRSEAIAALRVLTVLAPENVDAHRLLGVALNEDGDPPGAELAFRAALKRRPSEARIALGLAEALTAQKRGDEALEVLAPFVNDQTTNLELLTFAGFAFQAAERFGDAVTMARRATWVAPESGVAEHNLAGALVDNRQFAEAEDAERRARAKGLAAPEILIVEGKAARGQGRLDQAIEKFALALYARPTYALAATELADALWAQRGEIAPALAILDETARLAPGRLDLVRTKARLLDETGDRRGAYDVVSAALRETEALDLRIYAAQIAVHFDPTLAMSQARRALSLNPGGAAAQAAVTQAHLALGEARPASALAEGLTRRWPMDQYAWALQATAWRMLDDARYAKLFDYERFVFRSPIDTPPGWRDLDTYLDDLLGELKPLHPFKGHQLTQSLRRGSQTETPLERQASPAIAAFFTAIGGPIRRYIEGLGRGRDPLRGRATGDYKLNGIWSVALQPNGFHVDHVHPKGWISSACHIALPTAIEQEQQGWLKFGEPGVPTAPALAAEHFVKPARGQLVLFPSYMWHGTVPFDDGERLSVAFDAIPA